MSGLGLPIFDGCLLEGILEDVAKDHGLTGKELISRSRRADIVQARAEFYKRAVKNHSREEIGKLVNRDVSTISHALNNRNDFKPTNSFFKRYKLWL